MTDLHTDANYVEVRGNVNGALFAPNFTSPDVWLTDDELEISYSVDYGYRVVVRATVTRTADGFTLVGAHRTYDGKVDNDTSLEEVSGDTRLALLNYAGRVDALTKEFIAPQVLRHLVTSSL